MAADPSSLLPVKLQVGEAVYRLRVKQLDELRTAVTAYTESEAYTMQYRDPEGDLINLSSDHEFDEALAIVRESEMPCLRVEVTTPAATGAKGMKSTVTAEAAREAARAKAQEIGERLSRRTIAKIKAAIKSASEDYRITTGGQDVPAEATSRAEAVVTGFERKCSKLVARLSAAGAPPKQLRGAFAQLEKRGVEKAIAPVQKAEGRFVSELVDSSGSDTDGGSAKARKPEFAEAQEPAAPASGAGASDSGAASAGAADEPVNAEDGIRKGDLIRLVMTSMQYFSDPLMHAGLKAILSDPENTEVIGHLKAMAAAGDLDIHTAVDAVKQSGRILPGVRTFARVATDICTSLLPTLIDLLGRLGIDKDEVIAAHMQGSMDGQSPEAKKEREELAGGSEGLEDNPVMAFLLGHLPGFVRRVFMSRCAGGMGGGKRCFRGHGKGKGRRHRGCRGGRGQKHEDKHAGPRVECEDPRFEEAMKALFPGTDEADETEGTEGGAGGAAASDEEDGSLPWGDAAAQAAADAVKSGADASEFARLMGRMGLPARALRVVHAGVECDGCGMAPIVGPRFKSAVKKNYDLCAICERQQGARRGDVYLKINHPGQSPAGIQVLLRDEAEAVAEDAQEGRGEWRRGGGRHRGGRKHGGCKGGRRGFGGCGRHWRHGNGGGPAAGILRQMFGALVKNGGMPGQTGPHFYFGPDSAPTDEGAQGEGQDGAAASAAPPAPEGASQPAAPSKDDVELQKAIQLSLDAAAAARSAKKAVKDQGLVGAAAAVAGAVHVALEEGQGRGEARAVPMIALQPTVPASSQGAVESKAEAAAAAEGDQEDGSGAAAPSGDQKKEEDEEKTEGKPASGGGADAPATVPLVPLVAAGAPAAASAAAAVMSGKGVVDAAPQAKFISQTVLSGDADAIYPGSTLVKAWRLENNGATSWPAGCRVVRVQGDAMGTPAEGVIVNRQPVAAGAQMDVCLRLTAPSTPGRHQGYWRLFTPDGTTFGHRLFMDIVVDNTNLGSVMSTLRESIGAAGAQEERESEKKEEDKQAAAAVEAVAAAEALAQAQAQSKAEDKGEEAQEGAAASGGGAAAAEQEDGAASAAGPTIDLEDPSYERYRVQLEALHGMGLRNQPLLVHHLDA